MNRHFIDYAALPCAPLGEPKGAEKQQASDGEWKPLRPGYEHRTLAGGATEVRSTPGYLPDVAPSVQREPAYQPEGFGYAHVDHRGHQGEAIPKRTELDPGRVMPEDVHGSCLADVPEGATHRRKGNGGLFYRHIKHGETFVWFKSAWIETIYPWLDEEMSESTVFERLPQPAAPTEWQSGPPPSVGWREVVPTHWLQPGRHCGGRYHSYFNGSTWNGDVGERADRHERGRFSSGERSDLHRDQKHYCWRGPRLTGPDWPEPQQ